MYTILYNNSAFSVYIDIKLYYIWSHILDCQSRICGTCIV